MALLAQAFRASHTCYTPVMFEITGEDVARLGDADLRTLVARLALAELSAQGLPCSAVTAGGHQDAKDGGIDVRVETTDEMPRPDFVPRKITGFQVKRPDMPRTEIIKEMRPPPDKLLRPSIATLAVGGGAYIVVSAQGSVADQPLQDRRDALREGLGECVDADRLHTDFYDRERLATWTNQYPGAAAWLRERIGSPLSGWRAIGTWSDTAIAEGRSYIISDDAKVVREGTGARDPLTISQALDELRFKLSDPGQCVRLIGLSGAGKTRFVEALFESVVGQAPALDPAISVCTDFAEDIDPSAREMARRLVETRQRCILVVDNCNPAIHGDLVTICTASGSRVSLLTVEYDVRDDEPERTEVFRLTTGSATALETWLHREFPLVSQVDRRTIAGFSDGNFRVARALADTLRRGESLGSLRSQDLFERLFTQRNAPDQRLLRDAEALALVYSFDGEGTDPSGELAALGTLAGRTVRELFEAAAELRSRDIVQARGRWRAVLPQAIANRLASSALRRIPPGALDALWSQAPERLLKSMSRRLGYLHDSAEAQATVHRWLQPAGPLGNLLDAGEIGIEIVTFLAPTAPDSVLAAIQAELDGPRGADLTAPSNRHRGRWIRLIKALAYPVETFERAASLLARFVAVEPDGHNSDPARAPFAELFHIHLSGTRASPEQRANVARTLLRSGNAADRRAGLAALHALLKTGHFSSSASFDFGARPRDFGWHPATQEDIDRWFTAAIALSLETIEPFREAGQVLGRHVRGLWRFDGVRPAIEAAAERFLTETGSWVDGWIGLRAASRFDAASRTDERTAILIDRLAPIKLIERSRAVVLSHGTIGIDVTDLEDASPATAWLRASEMAVDLGKAMAQQETDLAAFLPEMLSQQAHRAFEFGRGLALGSLDAGATWNALSKAYADAPKGSRYVTALGGFLAELKLYEPSLTVELLEAALRDETLRERLPYLQSRTGLDAEGLDRLRRLAETGRVPAWAFVDLAGGVITDAEPIALLPLLDAIGRLDDGAEIVIDVLHLKLRYARSDGEEAAPELMSYGRELLRDFRIGTNNNMRDQRLGELVELCFAGEEHHDEARAFCQRFLAAVQSHEIYAYDSHALMTALLKTHPLAALDCLVDQPGDEALDDELFEARIARASPIETVDPDTLLTWARSAPERRFPRLGMALSIFKVESLGDVTGLSPHFLSVLTEAPDKTAFLGEPRARIVPDGWSGSLADNLSRRKDMLAGLSVMGDADVDAWLVDANRALDGWIAAELGREMEQEETFE